MKSFNLMRKLKCKKGLGGGDDTPPERVTPQQSAQETLEAQLATMPRAQKLGFQLLTDPESGLGATTREFERVRQEEFPEEQAIREALTGNVLRNLLSPTGISPEQQEAITTRRGEAQDQLVRALRQRGQLGGGLFGGRSQVAEQEAVQGLQRGFAEEDIAREERARLNAINAALPILQILFPDVGISQPQFQSPVASGDTALQAGAQQRGQDVQFASQQAQARAAQTSALFNALGQAGAAALAPATGETSLIFAGGAPGATG